MAYICTKNIKCVDCPHYKYDEDYGDMACFAKETVGDLLEEMRIMRKEDKK